MPKFKIKFSGEHFRTRASEKRFFGSRTVWKDVGFYTTRFVKADDDNEAIASATALLEQELSDNAMYTEKSVLAVVAVTRDDDGYDAYAPGSGFTFYSGDG